MLLLCVVNQLFTAFGLEVQQLPNSSRKKYFSFSLKTLNTHYISNENSLSQLLVFPDVLNDIIPTSKWLQPSISLKIHTNSITFTAIVNCYSINSTSLTPSDHRLSYFFGTLYHFSSHMKYIPYKVLLPKLLLVISVLNYQCLITKS
jgi:hypothetical protein